MAHNLVWKHTIYYGVLDGNHRVEAFLRRDHALEEAHNEELTRDTSIAVRVHRRIGKKQERILADRQ